jgi:hypothetical protein
VTHPNYCVSGPGATLSWTFVGDAQTAFQIVIKDSGAIIYDTGKAKSASGSYAVPPGTLNYNKTYTWTLTVWDTYDVSNVIPPLSPDIVTKDHEFPYVEFSWIPANPTVGETIKMIDQSHAHDVPPTKSWAWSFPGGTPANSNQASPTVVYGNTAAKTVTLTVTDSSNYSCSKSKTFIPGDALPNWKEVKP